LVYSCIQNRKQETLRSIQEKRGLVSLWLYDGNRTTPPSFITPPYISQVAVNLTFFATRQASTTFAKSSNRLNLKASALWTAPTAVATGVPS
jgi:hypothetical protein